MRGRVEAVGSGGDGIVQSDGRRWYVPYTAVDDQIEFEPVGRKGGPDRARLLNVHESGPDRVKPTCQHFGRCGGCALQHLSPDYLAEWKVIQVKTTLERRGFASDFVTLGHVGAPGSRRRVNLTALRPSRGPAILGFHERRGRNLIAVKVCPVLEPALEALIQPLRALLTEVMPNGTENRIQMNATDGGVDLTIEGSFPDDLTTHERMTAFAADHDLARVSVADDVSARTILSRRDPKIDWDGVRVIPPAGAFLQADRSAEAFMRRTVRRWSDGCGPAVDLFAGAGTLTTALPLQHSTLAVDSDADALSALRAAFDAAQVDVRTEVRNLFRRPLQGKELDGFDLAVLDPPATGAKDQSAALAHSGVTRIIYASCSPSSFARDARILADGGFILEQVAVVDQFYWSPETELIARFVRTT